MSDELAMCKSKRFSSSGRSISPVHRMRGFRWLLMLRKDDHDDNHGYDMMAMMVMMILQMVVMVVVMAPKRHLRKHPLPLCLGDLHLAYGADRGTLHR